MGELPELPPPGRLRRALLALIVVFLGGSGLVYEYCLSTLASHLLGNSVEQFSIIIALMLFAMGLAGIAQRWITDEARLVEHFVWVEVALALVGGGSAVGLCLAFAWLDHFRLALYGLAMAIGFFIGLEIPLLLRINQRWRAALRDNVGDVLSLDYIGALAGALVWAYVLLPRYALDDISLLLGALNLVVSALTLALFWRHVTRKPVLIGGLVAASAALWTLGATSGALIEGARQQLYRDPIRHHQTSIYQDIVVTGAGPRFSLYLNGRLQFDSEDEYVYHELLVHPAMAAARARRRVLVLGGGDGLAVREVLRWPEVEEVLLVDLDPAVTALAREYPPLVSLNEGALLDPRVQAVPAEGRTPGELVTVTQAAERPRDALRERADAVARVHVLNLDADAYLRRASGPWDVVIADFPDPSGPDVAKLFSLEFYQQLTASLAPGGVVVVQSGSPYGRRGAFWAIADTLEAAGLKTQSLHAHVPSFGEWGWHLARADRPPQLPEALPFELKFASPEVIAAASVFPRTLARPQGPPRVSTRLDPQIMRLYQAREPLEGPTLFPGSARR